MNLKSLKYVFKVNYAKRAYIKKNGKGLLILSKWVSNRTKRKLCKNGNNFITFDHINPVNQSTHPDIIRAKSFSNKFILTVSGYPFEIARFENPFVFISDDGLSFNNLFGEKAVVEIVGEGKSHYSDGELLEHNGKLFLFYRMCYKDCLKPYVTVFCRTTTDLQKWSEEIEVFNGEGRSYLSPSFVKKDGSFYAYFVDFDDDSKTYNLKRVVDDNALFENKNQSETLVVRNAPLGKNIWHIDIVEDGVLLRGLFVFMNGEKAELGTRLYYAESKDGGKTWDVGNELLFDINYRIVKRVYRSTMIKTENGWDIYYSVCTKNDCWFTLLSRNNQLGL